MSISLVLGDITRVPADAIAPGFALQARFVIHAVGPVWHGGDAGEPRVLGSGYRRAVRLADERALAGC